MHEHVSKWEFRRGSSIMLGLSSTDKRTNLVCVCARVFVCISHLVWVLLSLTFCIRVCVNVGGGGQSAAFRSKVG